MALSDTARLISSLELQDKFTKTADAGEQALGGLEQKSNIVTRGFGLMQSAGGAVGGAFDHLKGRIGQLISGPLGLLGLGAGLFGVGKFFTDSVTGAQDFGKEVGRIAALTGLGTEQTSKLAGAFHHFGIETDQALTIVGFAEKTLGKLTATGANAEKQADDLAAAQRDLALAQLKLNEATAKYAPDSSQVLAAQNRVADAQDALNTLVEDGGVIVGGAAGFFNKYGLALTDASGKIKDFNTLLLDSADFFNNKSIPAETKAAALATLYGKQWQTLIPILSAGRKGIEDAEEEAAALGLTLTKDNLTALQKLKTATRDWGTALGGLKLQLGLAVVPLLTGFAEGATRFLRTTDEFGRTGSQRIVGFFKDVIAFGEKAFGVIQDKVVPLVKDVIDGWNNLPDPLKDLLVKGTAGNFAIKFLLGFSPVDIATRAAGAVGVAVAGVVGKAFGGFVLDFFGRTAAQKLIPQVVSAVTPIPVFVTNPGFGLPVSGAPVVAGEVAAGAAGVGIRAIITSFLGVGTAIALGEILGNAIGKAVFFDPTIKPAVEFEQRQFDSLLGNTDPTDVKRRLAAIDAGIADLEVTKLIPPTGPLGGLFGPGAAAVQEQIDLLKDQRAKLQEIIDNTHPFRGQLPGAPGGGPPLNTKDDVDRERMARGLTTLADTALPALGSIETSVAILPSIDERLAALGKVAPNTKDDVDRERQARENATALAPLGSIEKSAAFLPAVNFALLRLEDFSSSIDDSLMTTINTKDDVTRERMARVAAASERTANKNFSPTVRVNVTTNTQVSVSNVVRTITSYTAALGSGPGGALDPSLL